VIDESSSGQEIGCAALELASARAGQRKAQRAPRIHLMHDIEKTRHALDLIENDPTVTLSLSGCAKIKELFRAARQAPLQGRREKVDPGRLVVRKEPAKERRLAGSARSEQEKALFFRNVKYPSEHTPIMYDISGTYSRSHRNTLTSNY